MSDTLFLLGRDYPELGPLGIAARRGGGAVALSRGARPKAYSHVDPNEDAALVACTRRGRLLAVADGFNGTRASELVIEAVRAHAEELVAAGDALWERVRELLEAVGAELAGTRSHSCLVVATLTPSQCAWVSLGDSALFRASDSVPVCPPNEWLVGPQLRPDPNARSLWSGVFQPRPGERMAAVTDGITNFTPDPATIARELASPADDASVARVVAEAALRGGAGDNVAIATLRAPTEGAP